MIIDNPRTWAVWNRTLLNVRLWDRHLQVWMWGARVIPSETGANCFRVDRLLFFARNPNV